MYSGTTLTRYSGRVMGAHQKIDRVARKHLIGFLQNNNSFPRIRQILHFEGKNGPDAIKRKSPAQNEPWHYYDPFDTSDTQILELIQGHYSQLINELRSHNVERSAFEASWLAHAIVDGLTPAHHFPYEQKLSELRGGQGIDNRTTIMKKLVIPGDSVSERVKNNWKMWGGKGLMTTHGTFEWGVASMIAPLQFKDAKPTDTDIIEFNGIGLTEYFKISALRIAQQDLYSTYYQKGWTPKLANQVRVMLAPEIIRAVTLAWYGAAKDANLIKDSLLVTE